MSRYALIPPHSLLVLLTVLFGFASPAAAATQARLSESYGKLPLHFEANRGQTHQDVRFLSRGPGYGLYLTNREAVLVLTRPSPDENRKRNAQASPGPRALGKSVALRMSLVGAARKPLVSGLDELPGKANYFIGKDQSKWRTNVPTYAKVHYREVYPGIDLVYYGNQRQLEYDFVVAPGADPKKIVLGFKGAEKLEIDAQGDLVLHAAGGAVRQKKPVIYQEIDGVRQEIAGSYVRKGAKRIGFKVAAYDRGRPLVIDPLMLSYSTFLGGSGGDEGVGIAVDADGNAYVAGATGSTDFPTTAGAFRSTSSWGVFVTKLNPTGSALVYSAFVGGDPGPGGGQVSASGIAVDADGNAYVTGSANSVDFPTTPGALQPSPGSAFYLDAFVMKLNPSGSVLIYSTLLGGSGNDYGSGIAVDANGNAYVTGQTGSLDFPTTAGAFQPAFGGGNNDAFVAKLNPTGTALVYSTFLGGSEDDSARGIAVDASGNAYATGTTHRAPCCETTNDFPTTAGAFQPITNGSGDAFLTKLNPTGSALVYSTYLGGSNYDLGFGLAVDATGNAYVTGMTFSTDFPTSPGAFQTTLRGVRNAFVTKLNPTGTAPVYSTYLGGSRYDLGSGVALDAAGNAHLTGWTYSTDFPTTPGAFQSTFEWREVFMIPPYIAFFTKLNPTGSALGYSTYLGGNTSEQGSGIAVDLDGNAYVTGFTRSSNFPTTSGAFQATHGGPTRSYDAFVAKFSLANRFEEDSPAVSAGPAGAWVPRGPEFATFSGGAANSSDVAGATTTFTFTGTAVNWIGIKCNVCGMATVSIDGGAPISVDTAGPAVPGSPELVSEPVFTASGLAAGTHTLVITVAGTTTSGGANIAVDAFDVAVTRSRSEENAATYSGYWTSYGAEIGTFSGGTIVAANHVTASATFSFTGTAVSWIGVKCNVCGIATVSIDGGAPTPVDTFGPGVPGSLTSEPVFSASGLAPDVTHTLVITVTGATTSLLNLLPGSAHVAVDAFDVTR